MESWTILRRLRRTVNKVRFVLNFRLNKWLSLGALGGSMRRHRQLSFRDRPGLWVCTEEAESDDAWTGSGSSSWQLLLQRTRSGPTFSKQEYDDVDKKADMFIANFYRQLQLERQISLELQYFRGNSFGSMKSP